MTYEEFADTRLAPLLRYAVMLTGEPHQAQDLVQETMVRVQLNCVGRASGSNQAAKRLPWRRASR
ncbi:hypothetical protein ACIA47_09685 [Micromonospora sp. NPDC051227]|uniref:hypothetical protein n=1 Tax=Micromonospora sp. NPDC051227 TaxID=3364285 RepID=UPI00379BE127